MKLTRELLALNESKKYKFQVRINSYNWDDLEFVNIESLEQLADEISTDGRDGKKIYKALPELREYLLDFYGGNTADVFDVVDEDYGIQSSHHDVLKVAYKFTIRYKKSEREPRNVSGVITFMPGNLEE
jgi:hypothetical protein